MVAAGLVVAAVLGAACGGGAPRAAVSSPGGAAAPAAGAGCKVRSIAKPVDGPGYGATVALATVGARKLALVADEDARSIIAVDVDKNVEVARTRLAGAPSQIVVTRDGRVVTLLRDVSKVVVLEAETDSGALAVRCEAETAEEPVAVALSPDETTALVTSGFGRAMRGFELDHLATRFDVALGREPRAVVVSDDGKTAYVSHAVGSSLSAVDLETRQVRSMPMRGVDMQDLAMAARAERQLASLRSQKATPEIKAQIEAFTRALRARGEAGSARARRSQACQGFALAKSIAPKGRVLAPQVFVDPGDLENRPEGYGDDNAPTESAGIGVIDEATGRPVEESLVVSRHRMFRQVDARDHAGECLLPRAAAVDPASRTLLVACFGIDAVVAYDAASITPERSERRRWVTGAGPTGLAVDTAARRAVVWSQFDRTVSTIALADIGATDDKKSPPKPPQKLALAALPAGEKLPAEYALGRILFHAAGDGRIAQDGRACASCHPDGRDDGITWATPDGPRRSIMLAGRVSASAPYSWNGTNPDLHTHVGHTFDRLGGAGLRSVELDSLLTYVTKMPAPKPAKADPAKVARGAKIFASREAQCSTCHSGGAYTDGATHDVRSKAKADVGKAFNTPSLHLVGGAGPFFHDGRYGSLRELLKGSDGTMGKTSHLSEADLDALETYLRTL